MTTDKDIKSDGGDKPKEPEKVNWALVVIAVCVLLVVFVFGMN